MELSLHIGCGCKDNGLNSEKSNRNILFAQKKCKMFVFMGDFYFFCNNRPDR